MGVGRGQRERERRGWGWGGVEGDLIRSATGKSVGTGKARCYGPVIVLGLVP